MNVRRPTLHQLSTFVVIVLFAGAGIILFSEFRDHKLADALNYVRAISMRQIGLGILFTVLGYMTLVGYDALALRQIGKRLPLRTTALASFVSFAFSHNLGGSLLTGGSLRFRLYSGAGLDPAEILSVTLLSSFSFGVGIATLLGITLLAEPDAAFSAVDVSRDLRFGAGALLLALVVAWLVFAAMRRNPVRVFSYVVPIPSLQTASAQLVLALFDIAFAGAVLFVFLPAADISFPLFLGIFVLASAAGAISHVPGGLGVFETALVLLLPEYPPTTVLGAALSYRACYYIAPLILAATLLSWHEFSAKAKVVGKTLGQLEELLEHITPVVIGGLTFVAGVVLLFSGSTPAVDERLNRLDGLLPENLINLSHLLASVAGVGLLILSRGLVRRLNGAWALACGLSIVGAFASALKGLDYEQAVFLSGVFIVLVLGRKAFRRKAALLDQRYSRAWFVAIAIVLAGSIWLGLISYRHVDYANELWWKFSLDADVSRFMRASVLATVLATTFGIAYLLRPAPSGNIPPGPEELARAAGIVSSGGSSLANAALAGDKHLLFAGDDAMLMYGISGRSWIALGDPVGSKQQREDLAWKFRETSDRHGAMTAFYQVGTEDLPVYLDMGLSATKIGEEALVPLSGFSLEGGQWRSLRQGYNRAVRDGLVFEVIAQSDVPAISDTLAVISTDWLAQKSVSEKGFSVGRFSREYLERFPCAVVRSGGKIVAFSNIWPAAPGTELSVDLMRYSRDAPPGVMDYMFTELMKWGSIQGYLQFSLGMAPLSGLEDRNLAPLRYRLGDLVYEHGEHFYNFEGLRNYKDKFNPEWHPRYLVSPGGFALPKVIFDVSRLIAGSTLGIIIR